VLGVFRTQNAPVTAVGWKFWGKCRMAIEVGRGTRAHRRIFSVMDQAPLFVCEPVRFISGITFSSRRNESAPPRICNGIENPNRGCTLVNDPIFQSKIPPSLALGGGFGPGVITGKADAMDSNATLVNPGGRADFL